MRRMTAQYHVTPITTNLEEYDGKLNALIAAGQTPDCFICNPGPNMDVYVNARRSSSSDRYPGKSGSRLVCIGFTDGIFERMTYDGEIYGSTYQLCSSSLLLQYRDL